MKKALFIVMLMYSTTTTANWDNPNHLYNSKNNFTNKTTVTVRHVDNVKQVCEAESLKRGKGGFGFAMQACAFWEDNNCTIVLPKKFTINNLGHEMLHCIQGNYHD